jgi:hypothetical protein
MLHIFTIFDAVSEKSGNIFVTETIGEAERQFYDALKNAQEGSLFHSHPEDFSLIKLGEFDPQSVKIVATDTSRVAEGKNLPLLPKEPADLR